MNIQVDQYKEALLDVNNRFQDIHKNKKRHGIVQRVSVFSKILAIFGTNKKRSIFGDELKELRFLDDKLDFLYIVRTYLASKIGNNDFQID